MDKAIVKNLFELWQHVGELINGFQRNKAFSAVTVNGSLWPHRVFNIIMDEEQIRGIIKKGKAGELSPIMTAEKPNLLSKQAGVEFAMVQRNMALPMDKVNTLFAGNKHIVQIRTQEEAIKFAQTASKSFGYQVGTDVIGAIVKHSNRVKAFCYVEQDQYLGCGLVFFDSNNNAGLHMIGTVPEGRGKGVGKAMTEQLLKEAQEAKVANSVLHASALGAPIYIKLGFVSYGEIETYRILQD